MGILRERHESPRIENTPAPIAEVKRPRHLDSEAMGRIRAGLDLAPGLDIEVGAVWQDAEALALAEELKAVFEGAGFKTRKLAQYAPPRNLPSGVAVFSSHQLDAVLSEAIAQIFAELGQERIQWLEDDPVPAANPAEPQPELKIIVSHR